MQRRTFVAAVAAAGAALAARTVALAQTDTGAMTATTGGTAVANSDATSGYAPVNGLKMFYAIHGEGEPRSAKARTPRSSPSSIR